MTTNFFSLLSQRVEQNVINLTIKKDDLGSFVVLVALRRSIGGDKSPALPTFNIKATAEELDARFFTDINNPVQISQEFLTNAAQYEQSVKAAQKANRPSLPTSEASGDTPKSDKTPVDPTTKKYEAMMKKVGDLVDLKKYGEAIGQLPRVAEFPQFKDAIETRGEEIRAMDDRLSLF